MLPRKSRIDRETFAQVPPHARPVRGNGIVLRSSTSTKINKPRFAVVVSKKVDKSAVARNRIRRRMYAAIETVTKRTSIRPAIYIFTVQDQLESVSTTDLTSRVDFLLKNSTI